MVSYLRCPIVEETVDYCAAAIFLPIAGFAETVITFFSVKKGQNFWNALFSS